MCEWVDGLLEKNKEARWRDSYRGGGGLDAYSMRIGCRRIFRTHTLRIFFAYPFFAGKAHTDPDEPPSLRSSAQHGAVIFIDPPPPHAMLQHTLRANHRRTDGREVPAGRRRPVRQAMRVLRLRFDGRTGVPPREGAFVRRRRWHEERRGGEIRALR